jgi:hypothetical protein
MSTPVLLNSHQMALFASRGFLMMEGLVPKQINDQFLNDIGKVPESEISDPMSYYGKVMGTSAIPIVNAGTPLVDAYPRENALSKMLALPEVAGVVESLVGTAPHFDHHFLHMTFPPSFYGEEDRKQVSQHWHQDSTIDPRQAFDVQMMYFPHAVTIDMGGTRYLPGSHLRIVSESAIGRYQNIKGQAFVSCKAGTILFMHMGIWHGGGLNLSEKVRYMFKIRMCPSQRQKRLWDTSDLYDDHLEQRPIFWTGKKNDTDGVAEILTRPEPWFEFDTGRLEYINRILFWRYLLGDDSFDADYWLTRIENDFD